MKNRLFYFLAALIFISGCQWNLNKIEDDMVVPTELVANFDINNNNCLPACDPAFSNTSQNANSYLWKFGNGDTSEEENPNYTYQEAGEYSITLIASNDMEIDSITKTVNIQSINSVQPMANFIIQNDNCLVPCDVSVMNTSQNATSYEWTFGDSNNSNEDNPEFIFEIIGNQSIRLVAFNSFGSDTITKMVNIDAPITFEKTFGEAGKRELGGAVVQTIDGGYAFAGLSFVDGYLVKTDINGNFVKEEFIGSLPLLALEKTFDNGFIITGLDVDPNTHFFVKKLDGLFNIQSSTAITDNNEKFYSTKTDISNGYISAGRISPNGNAMGTIFPLDENLNKDTILIEEAITVLNVIPSNDSYIFLAYGTNNEFFVGKTINQTSNLEWTYPINNGFDFEERFEESDNLIIQDEAGNILLAGFVSASNTEFGLQDAVVVKLNSSGGLIWQKNYGGALDDRFASIQQTNDGGYIMTGRTNSTGNGGFDVYLLKIDSEGEKEWEQTFGGIIDDFGCSVKQTEDNGFIIVGSTKSFGNMNSNNLENAYLIKTDFMGNVY